MGDQSDWVVLNSDLDASAAINSSGELWMWGDNAAGNLGQGDTTQRSSPTQVGSLTDWATVHAGYSTPAVKTDGTLWIWGLNQDYQLATGDQVSYSSPIQVGSLTDWSQTATANGAAGVSSVKTDGTLWNWGDQSNGMGGTGAGSGKVSSPVQIGSDTDWVFVATTVGEFAGGIKNTDEVWMWGNNEYGQLGQNDTTNYSSPVQVAGAWSKLSGGSSDTLAIKTDGTLWGWGRNNHGSLGLGNKTSYSTPQQVGSLTDWSEVVVRQEGAVALKTDGTIWTWGEAGQGELGNGTVTDTSSPAQVGSDTDWLAITGQSQYELAGKSA